MIFKKLFITFSKILVAETYVGKGEVQPGQFASLLQSFLGYYFHK